MVRFRENQMKIKVQLCPLAKKHHQESPRQFAHVFHRRDTICVTPEFYNLPQLYRLGILLHECGHLNLFSRGHSEQEADEMAEIISAVPIHRRTFRGMKNLEHVANKDRGRAMDFLRKNLE